VAAVDNGALEEALLSGAQALGLSVDPTLARQLIQYEGEILRWNARVNLVGRRSSPMEVMERHLLDSIAALPDVGDAGTLIDIGAGAGLPGIPLKLMRPALDVTLVEATGKKAAFMRSAIESLHLGSGIRVRQARARGAPFEEQLPRTEVAISRALSSLPQWLSLGLRYVGSGGRVIAMLARADDAQMRQAARQAGAVVQSIRRYELPFSSANRTIAVFQALADTDLR
jgi:16S rRNA (guanine527-N7)-methyltransferase